MDLPDTVQQARAQLASAQQMQVTLQGSIELRKVALAALVDVSPADLPPLQPHALPTIEGALPDDARLDLIARRPDIAASRWQVEAALKQTDVARAQFFPDVSINAMAGLSSTNQGAPKFPGLSEGSSGDLGNLFDWGSRVFGITPAVHLADLRRRPAESQLRRKPRTARCGHRAIRRDSDEMPRAMSPRKPSPRSKLPRAATSRTPKYTPTACWSPPRTHARAWHAKMHAKASAAEAQLLQQRDQAISLHAQALSTDLALIKALGGGYRVAVIQRSTADTPSTSPTASTSNLPGAPDHERL